MNPKKKSDREKINYIFHKFDQSEKYEDVVKDNERSISFFKNSEDINLEFENDYMSTVYVPTVQRIEIKQEDSRYINYNYKMPEIKYIDPTYYSQKSDLDEIQDMYEKYLQEKRARVFKIEEQTIRSASQFQKPLTPYELEALRANKIQDAILRNLDGVDIVHHVVRQVIGEVINDLRKKYENN